MSDSPPKKGASDPLFNPPGLKTRKTVMGLAPPPHLGGANPRAAEAEDRKQRVLARIAAADANDAPPGKPLARSAPPQGGPSPTPRAYSGPPAAGRPPESRIGQSTLIGTQPPPPAAGATTPVIAPFQPNMGPTGTGPLGHAIPAGPMSRNDAKAALSSTFVMTPASMSPPTPGIPLTLPRSISSDNKLPAASGWDIADAEVGSDPNIATAVMEAAPNTARMLPVANPVDSTRTVDTVRPTEALALRPQQHAYERHSMSGRLDPRLILLIEPHSPRASSFRLLRDSLASKNMPRVVAVSSAAPNDGKTTCAINLALAMAEQPTTRVLLLDGNFFEPELGTIFTIDRLMSITPPDADSWLSPYKIVEVRPTLHVAGIPRRQEMNDRGSGGGAPLPSSRRREMDEPAPRFDQQRFDAMIDRLVRVSYDYIIIDTPALRATPEVSHLLAVADGTLLAVRAGGTTTRDLRHAADQIPKNKALGIALIDA